MSKSTSFRRKQRQAIVLAAKELRNAAIVQCDSVQRLTELELELRISESRNDRKHRSDVFNWEKPLLYLFPLMMLVVLLWAPLPAWAKLISQSMMFFRGSFWYASGR